MRSPAVSVVVVVQRLGVVQSTREVEHRVHVELHRILVNDKARRERVRIARWEPFRVAKRRRLGVALVSPMDFSGSQRSHEAIEREARARTRRRCIGRLRRRGA